MESTYEQAYKILNIIDERLLEELNLKYKDSCELIRKIVTQNDDLNDSRSKTKSAIQLLNEGGYANSQAQGKNILNLLEQLKENGRQMDISSRELRTMLDEFNDFYIKNSEKFSADLLSLFEQLSEGRVTGTQLIVDGKNLGKQIQDFINNELEYQISVFKTYIGKKSSYFYGEVDYLYREVQRLDEGRLPSLRFSIWTDLEFDDLFLRPAYRNGE